MSRDLLLVTVECARWDYRDALGLPDRLDATRGRTAAHYTRPSVAGLLTGQWGSVVAAEARTPTLAGALAGAGYDTAAVSYSPQTTAAFAFDHGFDHADLLSPEGGRLSRGSPLRERLAERRVVRWLKRRLRDKHATFEHVPHDAQVVDRATTHLTNSHDGPLFLWAHLMGSHRPYGWIDQLPRDASVAAAGGDTSVRDTVVDYYERGLERVGERVCQLVRAAPDDAVVVVAGDHGEGLGEDGIFFHGGYRRRVVDALVDVPVYSRGLRVDDGVSLLDVPAHICHAVDVDAPPEWDARLDRDHALTIAPWHDTATVRYQGDGVDLTFRDADRPVVERATADSGTRAQLRALGYVDIG